MRVPERKEKEREEKFEAMVAENFPQINVRHQTTDPGNLENIKQNKCKNKTNK
jgi:hypothetical protein